jgi:hypothetical protein
MCCAARRVAPPLAKAPSPPTPLSGLPLPRSLVQPSMPPAHVRPPLRTHASNPPLPRLPAAFAKGAVTAGQDALAEAACSAVACIEGTAHNQIAAGDACIEAATSALACRCQCTRVVHRCCHPRATCRRPHPRLGRCCCLHLLRLLRCCRRSAHCCRRLCIAHRCCHPRAALCCFRPWLGCRRCPHHACRCRRPSRLCCTRPRHRLPPRARCRRRSSRPKRRRTPS